MTFALMALLLGGLTISANAQVKSAKKAAEKKEAAKKVTTTENWETVLKDFEAAVDETVNAFDVMQKSGDKKDSAAFNKFLKKAEGLQTKLEKAKNELSKSQGSRFNKAKEKLSKVYKKG